MIEKVYTFGKYDSLIGIVTKPDSEIINQSLPAVLLWNAGLLHRVGPYRLNVELARKLASRGFTGFRFDLSGIGDSDMPKDKRSRVQRAFDDIREAMDFLTEEVGVQDFVLIGLCSGADNAHPVAVEDSRVSGVVFLDAYGYRTWGFYPRYYLRRVRRGAFTMRKWKNLLRRRYRKFTKMADSQELFGRHFPPKKEVKADLLRLLERNVNLLYVYTGGIEDYYCYQGQFEDMFGIKAKQFQDRLQIEYFKNSDHIYTLIEDRNKVIKTVCDWMLTHYNGSKPSLIRFAIK